MSYPDYIYEPETGYLRCEKSKGYFIDGSEYGTDKFKKFNNYGDVKNFLSEEKYNGRLGIKIN